MDWGSILEQAKSAIESPKYKAEIDRKVDNFIINGGKLANGTTREPLSTAGAKFIEILQSKIQSHAGSDYSSGNLGKTAVSAASNLSSAPPVKFGGTYYVDINFEGNLHRNSLVPEEYDGIDNIIALLNTGYDAGHIVSGIWQGHGDSIRFSLKNRAGAFFIQEAVEEFMASYADSYGIIGINISEVYE